MMKYYILNVYLIAAISACSTSNLKLSPENKKDVVLSRIDNLEERPGWLKESQPFIIKNGKVISLGSTTIPSDHRVSAAYRIAQNNAKAGIATAIEQRLSFIFQNAEEGTEIDSSQVRYISGEASNIVSSSIRPGHQYWEKIATTTDDGERVTQYKIFSTVVMPEKFFKGAIKEAIRNSKVTRGISSDFSDKVDQHWDKFVNEKGEAKGE
jgi:hypothetical protein